MPLNSESFAYCYFRETNGRLLDYFRLPLSVLSIYFLGITYTRSFEFGKRVFEIVLASTGIFLASSTYLLTDSSISFYLVLITMYITAILPFTFDCEAEPEAFSNFFTSLGLLLLLMSDKSGSLTGIAFASFVSSIGLWCKLSALEVLWGSAYLIMVHGIGPEIIVNLSVLGVSGLTFALMLTVRSCLLRDTSVKQPNLLLQALSYQKYDLSLRDTGNRFQNTIKKLLCGQFIEHQEIILPLTTLFFLYVSTPSDSVPLQGIVVIWAAISCVHCVLRKQFRALYFYMVHFPLAIGAAQFLDRHRDSLASSWWILVPLCGIYLAISIRTINRTSFHGQWNDRLEKLRVGALDYLSTRVNANDAVFQDGGWLMIYTSLGCKHPPHPFTWADRMRYHFNDPQQSLIFLSFFREQKPKYLVFGLRHINLTYLEQLTGLRYRLVRHNQFSIYELCETTMPSQDKLDASMLFKVERARLQRDIDQLAKENARATENAITLMNFNKLDSALSLLQSVEDTNIGTTNIHLLKGLTLSRLGNLAKAKVEFRKELDLNPNNREAYDAWKKLAAQGY